MKTGVSYYGNRILQHVKTDMAEIRRNHCTFVVHTCSENDLQYYHRTIEQIVDLSHEAGLEVWLDPWGVGRVFGGEAYSRLACERLSARQILSDGSSAPAACLNQPALREFMGQWIRAAAAMGADVLFWDEPHFIKKVPQSEDDLWACRCEACQQRFRASYGHPLPERYTPEVHRFRHDTVEEFVRELCDRSRSEGCRNAVCFLPKQENGEQELAQWERLASIENLDILGTDPYWWDKKLDVRSFVGHFADTIARLANKHGKEGQIWIQNFMITPQTEEAVRTAIRTAYGAGIRNIAAWSFWGAGYMSWLRSEQPERVWNILGEEYARLQEASQD
jgi:hypothetical protein